MSSIERLKNKTKSKWTDFFLTLSRFRERLIQRQISNYFVAKCSYGNCYWTYMYTVVDKGTRRIPSVFNNVAGQHCWTWILGLNWHSVFYLTLWYLLWTSMFQDSLDWSLNLNELVEREIRHPPVNCYSDHYYLIRQQD